MSDDESKAGRWFAELKRRKVFRVAAVYLVVAWLLVQVAGTTFEPMGLPPWTLKLVITLAALGFPLACALAWAFDVTAKGIERTPHWPRSIPPCQLRWSRRLFPPSSRLPPPRRRRTRSPSCRSWT